MYNIGNEKESWNDIGKKHKHIIIIPYFCDVQFVNVFACRWNLTSTLLFFWEADT